MDSWYTASLDRIKSQCQAHPELSREELKRYCSQNYPWQHRRGWAYKSWLRAMHDIFGKNMAMPGQDDLFSHTGHN